MKSILASALLAAASFVPLVHASAQTGEVRASVPFAFTIGSRSLPAGKYTISSRPGSPFIRVENWQARVQLVVLSYADSGNDRTASKLVFHKYGNQYFLAEVDRLNSSTVSRLVMTKSEKKLKAQTEQAGLQHEDPVLVALN